ncbi:hypothetical protein [Leptolyngbya sp. ST-U4]|uniref:hypothetical protein n=1 Tax=Leptolyngbya sp. ST-U4 TaxID=2933912 RepID=UPI003298F0DC
MPVEVFYPYRVGAEMIVLNLDIPDMEEQVSDESLPIYRCQDSEIQIRASVIVPDEVRERVFHESEQADPPVKLWLIVQSLESRSRRAFKLEGDGQVFEALIDLDLDEWAGKAEFQAVLVRTTESDQLPAGYASDVGARLAWSRTCLALFREPPVPQRDVLRIQWKKFEGSQKSRLFALDHTEPVPKLWLNAEVEGLYDVLNSRAVRGWNPAIAENTSYLIAHQVWTSLLATAISHLAETGEPDEAPDLAELLEWERTVLDDWIEALFPDRQREAAFTLLLEQVRHHYFREELLFRRIPEAIQEKLNTHQGFAHLVKESGR